MTVRYIVRPSGILSTPTRLKENLSARRVVKDNGRRRFTDNDFYLAIPDPRRIDTRDSERFRVLRDFYVSDKFEQRRRLMNWGLPVPLTAELHTLPDETDQLVIRPRRHRAGQGWTLTDGMGFFTYNRETQYCSAIFPKTHEYRVIYCKGQRVATLLKQVPSGLTASDPWNHANGCRFISVNNQDNDRLRHTDAYNKLSDTPVVGYADLIGVDILLNNRDRSYVVAEINFCPSIKIERTFRAIRELVNADV